MLHIVDRRNARCLAAISDTSILGRRVARELRRLANRPTADFAEAITATGSDAALFGGSASSPVAQPAPHGVTETVGARMKSQWHYVEFGFGRVAELANSVSRNAARALLA